MTSSVYRTTISCVCVPKLRGLVAPLERNEVEPVDKDKSTSAVTTPRLSAVTNERRTFPSPSP